MAELIKFTVYKTNEYSYDIGAHDYEVDGQVIKLYREVESSEHEITFETVAIISIPNFTHIELTKWTSQ